MQMHATQTTGSPTCLRCSPCFIAVFVLLLVALSAPVVAQPELSATPSALASSANARQPGGDVTLEVISAWGGPVNTVDIQGNLAYIGSGLRLVIVDITDLSNITELGSINLLSTVQDLVVRDGYAYVVTWTDRRSSCGAFVAGPFVTVDVSDPSNPVLASTTDDVLANLNGNDQVELYGNIAFVLEGGEPDLFDITDPENIIFISDIPLVFDTFEIDGDLLYGANDGQLEIYDLSPDPLNPTLLGSATVVQQVVNALTLAVHEGYAYLTIRGLNIHFLVVFDVSNPRLPFIAGIYDEFPFQLSGEHSYGLDVSGGLAYVATGHSDTEGGLVILDVATDPANPTLVSTFDTHASVHGVRIFGTTAYLLDAGEGLVILDVSDPAKPVRLGGYYSPAYLRKMKKIGDLLYVSDAWNGLTVLDVSDPHSTPTVVGVYQTPTSSPGLSEGNWGLDVRDGFAYLSEGRNGFEVVDVSNPVNPVSAGAFKPWPDGVTAMDLKLNPVTEPPFTDILHVSTEPGALLVNFDVSSPSNITEIGSALLGGGQPYVYDIEVTPDGQYAHVARSLAVQVVDVSDPTAPAVIYTGGPNDVLDLALDGDIRYLANSELSGCDDTGALHIENISDLTNPTELTIVDLCYPNGISATRAVTVANGRAYVFGGFNPPGGPLNIGTLVYDITDPRAPILLGFAVRVGTSGSTWQDALLVDEPYLYLATSGIDAGQGLVLIEVAVAGTCPWDLDGNGSVGVKDFLLLLGAWGPNKGHPADFDGNGDVGVSDFLALLANWGPCP